ncbi:mitochondrial large subunit ribosomal protein-domain-containing protein [Microdochium trichocladiopsis]|uniref:Large ribosomal subunit protein mL49 n=1 Tax=Microdochium trichocladiopsis TaxID=1682393 RepID=A0A9P8Y395_9PEZI|nr:mitochondrial large subunit ribosomal protein-domain-containing protein [Microdochium trichocladiopsis]KAH7028891.1 mitochondrial large subunit ribosomal protein-domain-containing protein [Microdochium trichocladiopsis]
MLTRTLRPLAALVRPAQARQSQSVAVPHLRSLVTSSTAEPAQPAETIATTLPAEPVASSSTAPRAKVPYYVGKNKFENFGVYHKTKRGGNLKTTEIKMVDGNIASLKEDLKAALELGNGDIAFNNTTRHIVIKGHKKPQVINFLNNMGF